MIVGMCGRYVSATDPRKLALQFKAEELRISERGAGDAGSGAGGPAAPDYNVAPTNSIAVVAEYPVESAAPGDDTGDDADEHRRERVRAIDALRWGLVPSWAKDPKMGGRMINARAETVAEKNAYRKPFVARRCIVPADGFYEWKAPGEGRRKQPYYIRARSGEPLAFAGLWDRWYDKNDDAAPPLRTATIVTTSANEFMSTIHDRMPVMLPESAWDEWLDIDNHDKEALTRLLEPAPEDYLEMYPVSTDVGNTRNNGARLIEPIDSADVIA